jgi:hypothetical protein
MMSAGPVVSVFLACFIVSVPVAAQPSAYLHGRVLDPSQSAVPQAAVAVVNEENGFRRTTESGIDGFYAVSSLEPGAYKITVRKEGFRTMIRFNVKVAVLEPTRADFDLTIGSVQETITVEGTAAVLGQEDASIGVRVFREDIQRVPLNGRGFLGLLELSPGTNVTPATRGEAGQFTANGQRPNANYFTVDGASANTGVTAGGLPAQATGGVLPAMSAFGSLDSLLPVEAVEEFRVETSNAVSELSRLPGANVSLTSRSGSNEFHGSAVYRFRNELTSANDWFANASAIPRGPLRLNDIAPSFGGPLKRNRTFFFLSYQHMLLRGTYISRQAVPSDDTRASVPAWIQPGLNLYPEPNGPSLGNGLAAWNGSNTRPSQLDSGMARIDHALTSRITVFGRYNDSPSSNEFGATEINRLDLRFRSLTAGVNVRPNSHWTVDLKANESQADADSNWTLPGQASFTGCNLEPMTAYLFPAELSCNQLVRFSIGGVGPVVAGSEGSRRQRQFQSVDSASWQRRAHTLRFGVDYRKMTPIRRDSMGALSAIADDITALTDKRNLWLGTSPAINAQTDVTELSLWAQDTWQISSRLTVTPGLRWELNPSPRAASSTYFLDPVAGTVNSGYTRPLWPIVYTNFAPRLGLAWRIRKSGSTVLRAGGGLFYDSSLSIATDLINSGPFSITQFLNGSHGIFSSLLSYAFLPNLRLPRLTQWNVTLDQALGAHDVLSVGYAGSEGEGLIRREAGGQGSTVTSLFAVTTNNGSSYYHALQAQYRRRVLDGLQALVSYSWSHSLDDVSSDSFLVWAGPGAGAARDHASSDFDLRHSLTAALSYELPEHPRGMVRGLGGWAIDGLLRARGGFPISVLGNEQYEGITLANAFRPDRVPGQPIWLNDSTAAGGRRLNPAAFVAAPPGTQGSLGRNSITGFGMSQIDLAIRREFRVKESRAIQLRFEAFNLLNHANFADPVKYLSSSLFGQSTSMLNLMLGTGSPGSGLAPTLQSGGARSVQVSVRFRF